MLVRLIVFAVVAFFAYLLLRRTLAGQSTRSAPRPAERVATQLVQDPHCGVYVDRVNAVERSVPGGHLFFCSERCAEAHLQGGKTTA